MNFRNLGQRAALVVIACTSLAPQSNAHAQIYSPRPVPAAPVLVQPARPVVPVGPAVPVVPATPFIPNRESVVMRDLNDYFVGGRNILSFRHLLGFSHGTVVDSVIVIASSDDARGSISVEYEGYRLGERYFGQSLEVFQIPVHRGLHRHHDIKLVTRGQVFIASIGATYRGGYPTPAPYPAPAPQPAPSVCELAGAGEYNGFPYNFRVTINGATLEGDNTLDGALSKLNRFVSTGACTRSLVPASCGLTGYGEYRGFPYNYRVLLNGGLFEGANRLHDVLLVTRKLKETGVCQAQPTQNCNVLPAGEYRGFPFNFRVAIGTDVVVGTNSYDEAAEHMKILRADGFCF